MSIAVVADSIPDTDWQVLFRVCSPSLIEAVFARRMDADLIGAIDRLLVAWRSNVRLGLE